MNCDRFSDRLSLMTGAIQATLAAEEGNEEVRGLKIQIPAPCPRKAIRSICLLTGQGAGRSIGLIVKDEP